jgi:hypothetical protein
MIMAVSGGIPKVSGINRVIVVTGPRPGRTPITVPRTTPRKQEKMFPGVKTTLKPK